MDNPTIKALDDSLATLLVGKIPNPADLKPINAKTAGSDADGAKTAGSDADGANMAGSDADGAKTARSDADGANTTGNDADGATDALLAEVSAKFMAFIEQLHEMRVFIQALSAGDLSAPVPGRRNYMAAPVKELHTQFSSLTWSMEQLAKGNVVSKLYYKGVLFEAFNRLVQKVSTLSGSIGAAGAEAGGARGDSQKDADGADGTDGAAGAADANSGAVWEWSVNSWRYHQILSALNNLSIMVLETSLSGDITYMNRPAREHFGRISRLDAGNPLGRLLMQCGDGDHYPIFREIFDDPSGAWYKVTSDKSTFINSGHTGYIHMVDNISEWKKHESSLKRTATTDPLTGVYNRRFGLTSLEEALADARNGTNCCAAFIDINGLKAINDLHGHNNGDYAIKRIADVLVSSVRDGKDIVCRYGGDEFIIIFRKCTPYIADKALARMHSKLADINCEREAPFDLSFSSGVIEIDGKRDDSLQDVIERMDAMMYRNKAAYKKGLGFM